MSTVGHLFVGAASGRYAVARGSRIRDLIFLALMVFIAVAPDLDHRVLPALGVPDSLTLGHRGATHSLTVAAATALIVGLVARAAHMSFRVAAVAAFLAIGSHAVLDTLSGGPGVAWLWPFTDVRFPTVRILPMAPANENLFTFTGLRLLLAEVVIFSPFLLYALMAKRTAAPDAGAPSTKNGDLPTA